MQGLNLNQDLGRNYRRNNNTLLVDEAGFDSAPEHQYMSSAHLRNGSMPGAGGRSLLSQNGSTIVGAQSNFNLKYAGQPGYPERQVMIKSNFLRKGQGRGGSPTEYDLGFVDAATGQRFSMNHSQSSVDGSPRKVTGGIVPVRRDN